MSSLKTSLLLLSLLFAAAATLPAQGARFLIPERIERQTEADDQGLQQWAKWPALKCPSCKGAGKAACQTCARFGPDAKSCPECKRVKGLKAPCRVCAGEGKIPDPLEVAPCAGCMGVSCLVCTVCGGAGRLKVGGAKRWSNCPSCRGKGGFPCTGCKGKRVMTSLQLKPSMMEAPLDKLLKAMKDLDKMIALFDKITPVGGNKARKVVKEFGKAFAAGKKLHPAFKNLGKLNKSYMSKIFAGANFQGHEENEANTFKMLKTHAQYYLRHQKRMMELALKRAEANAAAAGK
jgi:hypothetical protein